MPQSSTTLQTVSLASSPSLLLGVLAQHESVEWSSRLSKCRHRTDFEVLSYLGRGGYGAVHKVKHKLDGCIYALKRVCISLPNNHHARVSSPRNKADIQRDIILREVQLLSRLHHENVVRYYGAWIEECSDEISLEDEDDPSKSSFSGSSGIYTLSSFADERNSDHDASPVCHLCNEHYMDWEVSFEEWGLIDYVLQPLLLCQDCYLQSLPPTVNVTDICIREKVQPIESLFILMEYCDGGSLSKPVEQCHRDNIKDDVRIWSYFLQCVRGIAAFHDAGIIHRDIKPNNIFVANKTVKIGDLGLATTTRSPVYSSSESSTLSDESKHFMSSDLVTAQIRVNEAGTLKTSQVGTYLYSAPEVADGVYTEKCDIFSLGVVLVELFTSFGTAMERATTLEPLRRGQVPSEMLHCHPIAATLARRMVSTDPAKRPTCQEILLELKPRTITLKSTCTYDHNNVLQSRVDHLLGVIEEKNSVIARLRELLKNHNIVE